MLPPTFLHTPAFRSGQRSRSTIVLQCKEFCGYLGVGFVLRNYIWLLVASCWLLVTIAFHLRRAMLIM